MVTKHKVPIQFKDVEAISYGTSSDDSLVVSFHNFENRDEMIDFQDYLFSRIMEQLVSIIIMALNGH